MNNILTYIRFRGDLTFKQSPFCACDAVALALLVGVDLTDMIDGKERLETVAAKFLARGRLDERDNQMGQKIEMVRLMAGSNRFRDILLENFEKDIDEVSEMTFYGLTAYTSAHRAYVIFRGTDGTLLSWKENFRFACEMPSAGQRKSLTYLMNVLKKPFMHVSIIGHSKGGGLAVFAGMSAPKRAASRIDTIYCFDGPGFLRDVREDEGYRRIEDRIKAYSPTYCIVGNLLHVPFAHENVECSERFFYQHDLFNWHLTQSGPVLSGKEDEAGYNLAVRLNNWLDAIPQEERPAYVDELFNAFEHNSILHITDLAHLSASQIAGVIGSCIRISPENRELIKIILKEIFSSK